MVALHESGHPEAADPQEQLEPRTARNNDHILFPLATLQWKAETNDTLTKTWSPLLPSLPDIEH